MCPLTTCWTFCVSHPAGLPDIFLDRSLGRRQVPDLLRAQGLRLVTLAEHYGIPEDEDVVDEDWLSLASSRDWVAFTKDGRIRTREGWAIRRYGTRCFCITRQDLSSAEMARRLLVNLAAITKACAQPGPFFYAVQASGIQRRPL